MSYTPWYAPVIGYGFSVFAEAILVKSLVETLWDCIAPESSTTPKNRPQMWQGDALARIEGVLYVALLQLGLGSLIGVWLILKVGGHWKRWMDDGDEQTKRPDGRSVFNIFLIGNAMSVLYSFVGFKLIEWIAAEKVLQVCWVSLSVIALTLAFEVSVFGAPDERLGEIPVGIVFVKRGEQLTEDDLRAFLEGRLAKFKIPERFIFSGEPLPRLGTGKFDRRALKARYSR